jgi:hypothetical protein
MPLSSFFIKSFVYLIILQINPSLFPLEARASFPTEASLNGRTLANICHWEQIERRRKRCPGSASCAISLPQSIFHLNTTEKPAAAKRYLPFRQQSRKQSQRLKTS